MVKDGSYNTKQLAAYYEITPKVFRTWLKRLKPVLGTRIGNFFSPEQVAIIIKEFGKPNGWPGGR